MVGLQVVICEINLARSQFTAINYKCYRTYTKVHAYFISVHVPACHIPPILYQIQKIKIMSTTQKFTTPPWDMDKAFERLTFEEAAWNSHIIEDILAGYAENIEMRDGLTFINGKQ